MLVAWVRRNCRQLVSVCRSGAGGIRWRRRIRRIVEAPTRWPSLSSSPWILRYPQLGFSRAIRCTNVVMMSLIGGRLSLASGMGVGAENPVTSCDLQILVEKAAEPVSS